MTDLEKILAEKIGISEEQAHSAADTALGFVKSKLPGSLSGYVDSLTGHGSTGAAHADDAADAEEDDEETPSDEPEEDEPAEEDAEETDADSDDEEEDEN